MLYICKGIFVIISSIKLNCTSVIFDVSFGYDELRT